MVSVFDSELGACLGEVLGEDPPIPDTQAVLFFKQWLAERNLGLVPIARAAMFEWPGRWLARVRTAEGDHAVVMFGAPSGALFGPADAVSRGGAIEEGWLLAPLDLRLATVQPYRAEVRPGTVAGLLVTPEAETGAQRPNLDQGTRIEFLGPTPPRGCSRGSIRGWMLHAPACARGLGARPQR